MPAGRHLSKVRRAGREGYARALPQVDYCDLVRCGSFRGAQGAAEAARPTQGENRHVCRPQCAPLVLTCFYGLALDTKESQGQTQTSLLSAPKIRAAPDGSEQRSIGPRDV